MASSGYRGGGGGGGGGRRNSNTQILQELEELSETMYQSHNATTARRTASLALPRTSIPPPSDLTEDQNTKINPKPRQRRMSLSPWRSRPKTDDSEEQTELKKAAKFSDEPATVSQEKKGIWSWKPMRALTHIGMQKLSCLFSVEVVAVQGLPASMNGLRLAVCVRKKENRDGAVQTMPSRVAHGGADFEETLFIRCHVYFTPGTQMKFEPRPFLVYVLAVDAEEIDFGKNSVDLSTMIQHSVEKSFEGSRIRQWDTTLNLSGKAKGGEIVLQLGFQIMEKEGGVGIYNQSSEGSKSSGKTKPFSPSIARKQSKTSFSIPSPRMSSRAEAWTPSQHREASDLQGIDELDLDEPAAPPPPPPQSPPVSVPSVKAEYPDPKVDEIDLPDFEVEDKGVEIEDEHDENEDRQSEENSDKVSLPNEVVIKEVEPDHSRLTELDSIAQSIQALESMIGEDKAVPITDEQILYADEDKVTREFLQMLEDGDDEIPVMNFTEESESESETFLPDLGNGLGCVIQTKGGGFLAAMNPLNDEVSRKDTAKLSMQLSKALILQSTKSGFELFQKMAAIGVEELGSELLSLLPLEEINGKTAAQIAFEGNKEGASSSAAAVVKSMVNAINIGRKERVSSGIWSVNEEPLTVDEILPFSLQKIEDMAIDSLKIQADLAEEEAPFDVSSLDPKITSFNGKVYNHLLASAISMEDWKQSRNSSDEASSSNIITLALVVQLRDPLRQFEAIGGPMIALIHATRKSEQNYALSSLQIGGIKLTNSSGSKSPWDNDKQRLTALQWLMAYGMGKVGRSSKSRVTNGPDLLWSISSRVMAEMWLKTIRNPDVKFTKS